MYQALARVEWIRGTASSFLNLGEVIRVSHVLMFELFEEPHQRAQEDETDGQELQYTGLVIRRKDDGSEDDAADADSASNQGVQEPRWRSK